MRIRPQPSIRASIFPMRKLTTILCLTLAVLLGSAGTSWSADFQKGLTAYNSGDYADALREWKPLAEQGNASAQFNLGRIYAKGTGVSQNHETAVKLFRFAAEQGLADAQNNLARMYYAGTGVPKDYVFAYMWANVAVTLGYKNAIKGRDILAKKMTPADISTAQKLARECVRKKYKGC